MTLQCHNCLTTNRANSSFCINCGQQLNQACKNCDTLVFTTDKYCSGCGIEISRKQETSGLYKHLPEKQQAERRQLTVLCCDMVGSTKMAVELDPEDFRIILRQYQTTCVTIIQKFGGYIARYIGDAILVYFGYPQANEDDAECATLAALQITTAITKLGAELKVNLAVRSGIATGNVIVGEQIGDGNAREVDAVGFAPHLATRLQMIATENSVILSDSTVQLCGDLFNLHSLGQHDIKGWQSPIPVWQVMSQRHDISRFKAIRSSSSETLLGRTNEINTLKTAWKKISKNTGRVVFISGDAGIGKSRLTQDFVNNVTTGSETQVVTFFQCHPYHQNTTLYPFTNQLWIACDFLEDDTDDIKLQKLTTFLIQYQDQLNQPLALPLLASLLNIETPLRNQLLAISPLKQQQLIINILCDLFFINNQSAKQDVNFFVFEDIHWLDDVSFQLLSIIINATAKINFFIIVTYRPEIKKLPFKTTSAINITLSKLDKLSCFQIIENISKNKLSDKEKSELNLIADGVPLYIEELTKSIVITSSNKTSSFDKNISIPSSLHDALMSRLDRIESTKLLIQIASVIGREFEIGLLQLIIRENHSTTMNKIELLIREDLIYKKNKNMYCFKHALIQEAAYQSLLKSRKNSLHFNLASILIDSNNTFSASTEIIAYHYHAAQSFNRAAFYWLQAAKIDMNRSAINQAIHHLQRALELLNEHAQSTDDLNLQFQCESMLAPLLMVAKGPGHDEVGRSYQRGLKLGNKLNPVASTFALEYGECLYYWAHGDLYDAQQLSTLLLAKAEKLQISEYLLAAQTITGLVAWHTGDNTTAYTNFNKVIQSYNHEQHASLYFIYMKNFGVFSRFYMANCLMSLGESAEAILMAKSTYQFALESKQPHSIGFGLIANVVVNTMAGNFQNTLIWAEKSIRYSTEQGFPEFIALSQICSAYASFNQNNNHKSIQDLKNGIQAWQDTGFGSWQTWFGCLYAKVLFDNNEPEIAINELEKQIQNAKKNGEKQFISLIEKAKIDYSNRGNFQKNNRTMANKK